MVTNKLGVGALQSQTDLEVDSFVAALGNKVDFAIVQLADGIDGDLAHIAADGDNRLDRDLALSVSACFGMSTTQARERMGAIHAATSRWRARAKNLGIPRP